MKFSDAQVKVRFTPEGKPVWAVGIAGDDEHGPVVGTGETLNEAASWAASTWAAQMRGETIFATNEAAAFYDGGGS